MRISDWSSDVCSSDLPAIAAVLALLGTAWSLRTRWPLFALGVFLFFAAHFIASTVVGLELAFEHRNHFALIGMVLAIGSLLAHASQRLRIRPSMPALVCPLLLACLCGATLLPAPAWRSKLAHAPVPPEVAP